MAQENKWKGPKICPLMTIAFGEGGYAECCLYACAWYDEAKKECVIRLLSRLLLNEPRKEFENEWQRWGK